MKRFKYLTLAALVAFAACDETEEPVVTPPVTGSIAGVVTIEGSGASGVTVTLSSGATATTDGSGAYSFTGVAAGAYTVAISGYASDAAFTSSAKAATISTAGQVVNVNFDGAYIRTSVITGSVAAGGVGLSGVTVSMGSSSTTTDSNGLYAFSGLRAGSYTVSISGYSTSTYTFTSTSQSVTVGVGESKVASFSGALVTTASVTGRMFIDENDSNDTFDSGLEANLAAANITIQIEGGSVNNTMTTQTAADGTYSFTGLAAGTYRLTILGVTGATIDPDLPTNVAYGMAGGVVSQLVTVTTGATGTANWPFNITRQAIKVYATLGTDAGGAGTNPIKGWKLDLYDTDANANAGGATGRLGQVTTGSSGEAIFRFNRSADVSPQGTVVDNLVYARSNTVPAGHAIDPLSEAIIEIKYNATDSVSMAPDTFDALNNVLVVGFKAEEIDGDAAAGWNTALRVNKSATFATTTHGITNSKGMVYYTLAPTAFPDTVWVRLSNTQTANGSHGWTSTLSGDEGTVSSSSFRYIWNGTTPASDTIMMGTQVIKYTDADIVYRAHHEADDSTGTTPTYTKGDNFDEAPNVQVKILNAAGNNTVRANAAVTAGTGLGTRFNLPTDSTYQLIASSTWPLLNVLDNDTVLFTLSGGDQVDTVDVLKGGAGFSTFAYKMDNQLISGLVQARDGTAAAGVKVRITAGPGNIQGTKDTTVVTGAGGTYTTKNNLREGPYTVTVMDSVTSSGTVWSYSTTLKTTTVTTPVAIAGGSGSANNTSASTASRDAAGNGNVVANRPVVNFLADRMDTKIQGLIANDRDQDFNTIDPTEGLGGIEVSLYVDNSGTATVNADSLVATSTTDANGAFSFSGLREGRYIVKPGTASGSTIILRALTKGDTAIVNTAAAAGSAATGYPDATIAPANTNGRTVGITSGFTAALPLPAWNYATSTYNLKAAASAHSQPHFTFLYADGQATGKVTKTAVAVSGMTISAVKCQTVVPGVRGTNWTSPPTIPIAGGTVCTPVGSAVNVTTNSSGVFLFTGLQEGIWMITANPSTAGLPDATTSGLFEILGTGDVETGNFIFP